MLQQALDPAEVDSALNTLPDWRHAGEFLVRVVPTSEANKADVQERVYAVENDPERCSFTDTETGLMIYLGDVGGEGISAHDLQTAAKIDSALAGAI
jgi:hypothetical protein